MALPSRTPNAIITAALRTVNILGENESAAGDMLTEGLDRLNELLDSWGIQPGMIHEIRENQHSWATDTASYTIGDGATWDQERPMWIYQWSVIPDTSASPVIRWPMGRPLTFEQYQKIATPGTSSGYPYALYYDRAYPLTGASAGYGTVKIYPTPDNASGAVLLYTPTAISAALALATSYVFPPGYVRAMRLELALELAEHYGVVQIPRNLEKRAANAIKTIKYANWRPLELGLDPMFAFGRHGVYDGESDSYE